MKGFSEGYSKNRSANEKPKQCISTVNGELAYTCK
jgi:hypothetical protein